MLKYKGGDRVGRGTYWSLSDGCRVDVLHEDVLPGDSRATFVRLPPLVMLLAGPFLGLLYVIFMPFIAIATVAAVAAGKSFSLLISLVGRILYFEWRPTEAYLAGRKKAGKGKDRDRATGRKDD